MAKADEVPILSVYFEGYHLGPNLVLFLMLRQYQRKIGGFRWFLQVFCKISAADSCICRNLNPKICMILRLNGTQLLLGHQGKLQDPHLKTFWVVIGWKKKHMLLERNLTIRSHDSGKERHFGNCGDTSIHLPLTRSAQPSGQLSLYLLNEFNSLWSEFTKGIIALTVGYP